MVVDGAFDTPNGVAHETESIRVAEEKHELL